MSHPADPPIVPLRALPPESDPNAWKKGTFYRRLPYDPRPLEGTDLRVTKVSSFLSPEQSYLQGHAETAGWLDQDGPHAPWFFNHSKTSPTSPYPMALGIPQPIDPAEPSAAAYWTGLDLSLFAHRIHVASAAGSLASRHASAQRMLWEALRGDDPPLMTLALQAGANPHEASWTVDGATPIHDMTPMSWAIQYAPTRPATAQLWVAGGACDPAPELSLSGLAAHWVALAAGLPGDLNEQWAHRFHAAGLLGIPDADGLSPLDEAFLICEKAPNALAAITAVVPVADRAALMNQSTHWLGYQQGGNQRARSLRCYAPFWPGLQEWLFSHSPSDWALDDSHLASLTTDTSSCPSILAPWVMADPLLPRTTSSWAIVDGHNEPALLGPLSLAKSMEFNPNITMLTPNGLLDRIVCKINFLDRVLGILGVPSADWDQPLVYDSWVDLKGQGRDLSTSTMRQEVARFLQSVMDEMTFSSPALVQALSARIAPLNAKLLNFRSGPYRDVGDSSDHPSSEIRRSVARKL